MCIRDRENTAVIREIANLMQVLLQIARENLDTIIPAYTHLQKAQPSTLAHYMMAYAQMFSRDIARFQEMCIRDSVDTFEGYKEDLPLYGNSRARWN